MYGINPIELLNATIIKIIIVLLDTGAGIVVAGVGIVVIDAGAVVAHAAKAVGSGIVIGIDC